MATTKTLSNYDRVVSLLRVSRKDQTTRSFDPFDLVILHTHLQYIVERISRCEFKLVLRSKKELYKSVYFDIKNYIVKIKE